MPDCYARYQRLAFDRPHPRVLRVSMSNPGKLNAADAVMHEELAAIWRDVDADPEVSSVILTGAGKAFSAGGDFEMIGRIIDDFPTRARVWKEARDLVYNVIHCSKPVVSAMRGPAVGAGLVCGLLADISIAANNTTYAIYQVYISAVGHQTTEIGNLAWKFSRPVMMYSLREAPARELAAPEAAAASH